MTRIIAGRAGSLRLDVPKSGTRPTSDRVREAIFSSLDSWGLTDNVHVLDLFAGSGALGLESASRGAASVTLVEKHAPAAQVVQRNVDRFERTLGTDDTPRLRVQRLSATTFLAEHATNEIWDVVFVDPPYDFSDTQLLEVLTGIAPRLTPEGLIMVERSTRDGEPTWPESLRLYKTKKYGETTLWWAELNTPA